MGACYLGIRFVERRCQNGICELLAHAHTHACTYARTHIRTHARTHARTCIRTHARAYMRAVEWMIIAAHAILVTMAIANVSRRSRLSLDAIIIIGTKNTNPYAQGDHWNCVESKRL